MKRNVRRIAQSTLSAALVLSLVLSNSSFIEAKKISKQESVYVNAGADGKVSQITVADWLKGSADINGTIRDESDLSGITNVKGDETFTQNGKSVEWAAKGKDIYYQGETSQELPIDLKITYKLDGAVMEPKDMLGRSGKVEIHVAYTNKSKQTKTIDGKETTLYTPFIMLTGMILPTEVFDKVEIDNGRVINDGSNQIAVGLGVPGLKESLDLEKDASEKIPDGFTVTADVKDFSMGNTFTYGSPNLFNELELDEIEQLDDLEEKLDDLTDAAGKIVEGSEELSDNMDKFADKMGDLKSSVKEFKKDGVDKLAKGIGKMAKGAPELAKGVNEYTSGVTSFASGTSSYVDGAKKITDGCSDLYTKVKNLPNQISAFDTGLKAYTGSVDKLGTKENVTKLKSGAKSVSDGITTLNTNLAALEKSYETTDTLLKGLKASGADATLIAQMEAVLNGQKESIQKLKAATSAESELKQGAGAVSGGVTTVMDGLRQLSTKSSELTSVTSQLNSSMPELVQGVKSLKEGGEVLAKNNTTLKTSGRKLQKAGGKLKKSVTTVKKGVSSLNKGGKSLVKASGKLVTGVNKLTTASGELNRGSNKLSEGASEFNREGIEEINRIYEDDIKVFLDRLKAIRQTGQAYKSFSGVAGGMDGDVKFVIETEEISKEE